MNFISQVFNVRFDLNQQASALLHFGSSVITAFFFLVQLVLVLFDCSLTPFKANGTLVVNFGSLLRSSKRDLLGHFLFAWILHLFESFHQVLFLILELGDFLLRIDFVLLQASRLLALAFVSLDHFLHEANFNSTSIKFSQIPTSISNRLTFIELTPVSSFIFSNASSYEPIFSRSASVISLFNSSFGVCGRWF